jgi:hypothetical protein
VLPAGQFIFNFANVLLIMLLNNTLLEQRAERRGEDEKVRRGEKFLRRCL